MGEEEIKIQSFSMSGGEGAVREVSHDDIEIEYYEEEINDSYDHK